MRHLHGDVARAADDDGVRHEVDVGTLEDARHLVLLVLVDRVEVCHGLSPQLSGPPRPLLQFSVVPVFLCSLAAALMMLVDGLGLYLDISAPIYLYQY